MKRNNWKRKFWSDTMLDFLLALLIAAAILVWGWPYWELLVKQ